MTIYRAESKHCKLRVLANFVNRKKSFLCHLWALPTVVMIVDEKKTLYGRCFKTFFYLSLMVGQNKLECSSPAFFLANLIIANDSSLAIQGHGPNWVCPTLNNFYTSLKELGKDKHSSLFCPTAGDEEKRFYVNVTCSQCY
jgi:hypothetical protein